MDDAAAPVITRDELNAFHSIDRALYTILAINLWRDPVDGLHILALLLWLERAGYKNVVHKVLQLPIILINEIADEVVACLQLINSSFSAAALEAAGGIPLLQALMDKDLSLQFFQINRIQALEGITKVLNNVCVKVLADIMQRAIERNAATQSLALDMQMFFQRNIGHLRSQSPSNQRFDVAPDERTMFVTFSKGYPVYEWEIKDFFSKIYGDCIESMWMQEVQPNEQSLFARIVFRSPAIIERILSGSTGKAKYTINGKHVWVRKFIPKKSRAPAVRTLIHQPQSAITSAAAPAAPNGF
uniref:Uncharacterized protein n=1 Tax=Kalanchoe fedtschenkoi TaxID=63787 RepID=A0A7N0ZSJ1_KALFE